MRNSRNTRLSQWFRSVKQARADMRHAQDRLFELQTGVPVSRPNRRDF
jgi:hypothetical protein